MKYSVPSAAAVACIVALGLATPGSAHASTESDLASAENDYAQLEYQSALQTAERVLGQRGLSHDVLVRATRVSALAHAAAGQSETAKKRFITLLQYDPTFKVEPRLGPSFTEPYSEAKGYWQAQGRRPGVTIQPAVSTGARGHLRVVTSDPTSTVTRVLVGWRWAPSREYQVTTLGSGAQSVEVRANAGSESRLDYYVRALDNHDNVAFEEGTPEAPKFVTVGTQKPAGDASEEKSFFKKPYLYIALGVVALGAGALTAFALRPTDYSAASTGQSSIGIACGGPRCD